jgi:hypothetical protein
LSPHAFAYPTPALVGPDQHEERDRYQHAQAARARALEEQEQHREAEDREQLGTHLGRLRVYPDQVSGDGQVVQQWIPSQPAFTLTGIGDETIDPMHASSDSNGLVHTTLSSGIRATTVRVVASVDAFPTLLAQLMTRGTTTS